MSPTVPRTMMNTSTTKNQSLFLDTSAFIALLNPRDQYHKKILRHLEQQTNSWSGVTTNLVLSELFTFFSRHGSLKQVIKFQESLLSDPNYDIVWIDSRLHQEACLILEKFSDQKLSFTDATSFALMRARGITHAVTFDQDFTRAGFTAIPD